MKHCWIRACVGALLAIVGSAAPAQVPSIPPSQSWARALPPGTDTRVKITEAYAKHIARDAYFWRWLLDGPGGWLPCTQASRLL